MRNKFALWGIASVLSVGLVMVPSGAGAVPISGVAGATQLDEAGLRQRFVEAGVPDAVQARLITKLKTGVAWDSQNGSKPVSVTTKQAGGSKITTSTFADGSLIINSIEMPHFTMSKGMEQIQSISSCRAGVGVGSFPFYDCHIKTNQLSFSIDFYSDGQVSQIGAARVSNYRNIGYWTAGATVKSFGFQLIRSSQSGNLSAAVRATLYVDFLAGSGSGVYQLTFHVRNMSKWDTSP